MVNEVSYTSIYRVLDNLHDHPMLADVTLEQAVRYAIRFISKHGYSRLYQDKIEDIDIEQFRGVLPCDLVSIKQVKDVHTGICMRSMTDSFPQGLQNKSQKGACIDPMNNMKKELYIPKEHSYIEEPSFKTVGRVIYTSFPVGKVTVAYKAISVDDDGYPLLIDNETYLDALEAYIKKQVFTVKYDQGKIAAGVLQNAQTDYAVASRLLLSEFTLPSPSEAESLLRVWNTMIPQMRHFSNGFRDLGNREYLKKW